MVRCVRFFSTDTLRAVACLALISAALGGLFAAAPSPASANESAKKSDWRAKGVLHIMISLSEQSATVFDDGQPRVTSRISSGREGYGTPTGIFSILERRRYHESNIYSNAPMPFMQRLTWSGIALHEGDASRERASHGCVRLPSQFARGLWDMAYKGARVIIAEKALRPVPFRDERLFVPRPLSPEDQALKEAADDAARDPDVRAPPRGAPISVFVSRKLGRLFVRQGFHPLFEVDVEIEEPDRFIGTHVFTAMEAINDGQDMRWTVVTLTPPQAPPVAPSKVARRQQAALDVSDAQARPATADNALARIEIPSDIRGEINRLLTIGASLIISDHGLGPETSRDLHSDFIVLGP